MIIATAGHVDHGKTQLVKVLTGVDTDTLVEEKKRALTIDVGFAYLSLDNGENIGFIDVPGHNRFIRNAICGLAATDFVLLIVAADDGVMPQTVEHLSIIDLLKIKQGAIVISKTDCVSDEQLESVKQQVGVSVQNTVAALWPVFTVSSLSNKGIEALKYFLVKQDLTKTYRKGDVLAQGNFRMPVDRVFSIKGVGLVATGTIFAGQIRQGDNVTIVGSNKRLRVRGLHVQNIESEFGVQGQRCAINLAGSGLQNDLIKRGSWVTAGSVSDPVYRFDAEVCVLDTVTRPLKHWTPVHLHHAASESTARIAVLESRSIQPGASGLVQIVSDHPLGASFGDHFIIRDQSARFTLGGGHVIDIFPPRRGRAKPERIEVLRLMNDDDHGMVLQRLLNSSAKVVDLDRFAANRNLTQQVVSDLYQHLNILLIKSNCRNPDITRQSTDELQRKPEDDVRWRKVEKALNKEGIRAMSVSELADTVELPLKQVNSLLTRGIRRGRVIRLSVKLLITSQHLTSLRALIENLVHDSNNDCFGLSDFRKATGIGRNRSIEMLECLDNQGITIRIKNNRQLSPMAARRFDQLLKNHHPDNGKDRTLVGRPVFKTGGGR